MLIRQSHGVVACTRKAHIPPEVRTRASMHERGVVESTQLESQERLLDGHFYSAYWSRRLYSADVVIARVWQFESVRLIVNRPWFVGGLT